MIKIPDGDRTDKVVDQDGIIKEIPLYASKQIANRLNDALTIQMRPDSSRIFDLETVNSALKLLVDGNSKPILLAMVQSDYNLSFDNLMSLTNISRPRLEGMLGSITAGF